MVAPELICYERRRQSQVFPDLDLAELASFIDTEDQSGAVRRYRDALRRRRPIGS